MLDTVHVCVHLQRERKEHGEEKKEGFVARVATTRVNRTHRSRAIDGEVLSKKLSPAAGAFRESLGLFTGRARGKGGLRPSQETDQEADREREVRRGRTWRLTSDNYSANERAPGHPRYITSLVADSVGLPESRTPWALPFLSFPPSPSLERPFSNIRSFRSVYCRSLSGHRRRSGRTSNARTYSSSAPRLPFFPLSVSCPLFPFGSRFCPAFGDFSVSLMHGGHLTMLAHRSCGRYLLTVPLVCSSAGAICRAINARVKQIFSDRDRGKRLPSTQLVKLDGRSDRRRAANV